MWHKIILAGNLGRDPEMRFTPSGVPVTNLSVATNREYKDKNGASVKETLWWKVAVWGPAAGPCNEFLHKGRQVLVEGTIVGDENGNPRMWKDNDGNMRASFEIRADTVKFIGGRNDGVEVGSQTEAEEIPFM